MKKLKIYSLLIMVFIGAITTNAQDKNNPWAIGIGYDIIDVTNTNNTGNIPMKDYFGADDYNDMPIISRLYVAKYLNRSFTMDLSVSYKKIDKILEKNGGTVPEENYYSVDLGLRYSLSSLFNKNGWFDPYAKFAVGWYKITYDNDDALSIAPGLGANFWISPRFGFNLESSYKTSTIFDENNLKVNDGGEAGTAGRYLGKDISNIQYLL